MLTSEQIRPETIHPDWSFDHDGEALFIHLYLDKDVEVKVECTPMEDDVDKYGPFDIVIVRDVRDASGDNRLLFEGGVFKREIPDAEALQIVSGDPVDFLQTPDVAAEIQRLQALTVDGK
jgi:hypothetical protein